MSEPFSYLESQPAFKNKTLIQKCGVAASINKSKKVKKRINKNRVV